MRLIALQIENCRVLRSVSVTPGPEINVVTGRNGAGKTSLLEAIYFLGRGRTFRYREARPLVTDGERLIRVVGHCMEDAGRRFVLGAEREGGRYRARIDGCDVKKRSEQARAVPIALITPASQALLEKGPELRRAFLDWAMFHVEPEFHALLMRYRRALKQRNAALRSGEAIDGWEPGLVVVGERIDESRRDFLVRFGKAFEARATQLGAFRGFRFRLKPGWDTAKGLGAHLAEKRMLDMRHGQTSVGPHRDDLSMLDARGKDVRTHLSRGEQKLLTSVMVLTLVGLMRESGGMAPLLLIDDLPSELDSDNRRALWRLVCQVGVQTFVSAIEPSSVIVPDRDIRMFHVEHGRIEPKETATFHV